MLSSFPPFSADDSGASCVGSLLTMGLSTLVERRITLSVFLIVKLRRNQHFGGNLLPLKVLDDHLDGFLSDAIGELNRITNNLSFQDCLLADLLAVEPDDFDLVGF